MNSVSLLPEIEERKSVTNWKKEPIAAAHWASMLEAARRAPSSWNRQPARYVLVTEPADIRRVAERLHRTNAWAEKAAALIVLASAPEDDDRVDGKDYYLYDCGLSMMSLVYQAQALGITCRQMIGWDERSVKTAVGIPDRYRVVVVAGIGYESDSSIGGTLADLKRNLTGQHKRYAAEHLFFWQAWGNGGNDE